MSRKQGLLERIKEREFLVSVQLDPPRISNIDDFKRSLIRLKKAGVKLVDINSSRKLSHDSIQLSVFLAQMGFEVIPHVTTRDSSINGLMNQILSAYSWGVSETSWL